MLGTFIKKIGRTFLGNIRAIYVEECTSDELNLLDSINFKLDFFNQFSDNDSGQRRNINRIDNATAFHTEIFENNTLIIFSPFNKNRVSSYRSIAPFITTFHSLIYSFKDTSDFKLILSDYWFEAMAIYLPDQKILISKRRNHINLEQLVLHDLLLKLNPLVSYRKAEISRKKAIILYHNHLAHHLLNELSSLQVLIETGLIENINEIYYHNLPVSKLEDIFPEIPASKFKRISHRKLIQSKFQKDSLLVPFQKSRFHPEIAKRLLASSINNDSVELKDASNRYYPIIWMSFRTGNRVWQNQATGLGELSKALKKSYPDPLILIDGYSLPFEIDPKNSKTIHEEIEREKTIYEEMLKDDKLLCNTISLIGKPIEEIIHWTQIADFYITHCGTLHHKIAWMADIPGIVHCNEHFSELPGHLTPGFTEKPYLYPPLKLSKDYISDTETERTNREGSALSRKFSNYTIDNKRLMATTMKLINELNN